MANSWRHCPPTIRVRTWTESVRVYSIVMEYRMIKSTILSILRSDSNNSVMRILNIKPSNIKISLNFLLLDSGIWLSFNERIYESQKYNQNLYFVIFSAVKEEDMLISADKQESKSFYLISKSMPLICLIICKTEDECKLWVNLTFSQFCTFFRWMVLIL